LEYDAAGDESERKQEDLLAGSMYWTQHKDLEAAAAAATGKYEAVQNDSIRLLE
jgi:hypothetical protein